MAITVTTIAKPTLIGKLVPGGSHTDGNTRYYIAFRIDSITGSVMAVQSPWSDEISATFDATNKQLALFVDPNVSSYYSVVVGRTDAAGDYDKNSTANFSHISSTNQVTGSLQSLGKSTVDADSNSGQPVLNIASTTGFAANDWIIIHPGGAREEAAQISSVSAGVSVTLTTNLVNTHTGANADPVWEALEVDDNADSAMQADWATLSKHQTNKIGMAGVQVVGTGYDFDDLYQDAALKELYIFRHDDNALSQIVGGGSYDARITFRLGNDSTTTNFTALDGIFRLWGRLSLGTNGTGVTLTLGSITTNSRGSGVVLILSGWRGIQHSIPANATVNLYDSQIIQTSGFIAAGALDTASSASAMAWGNDFNLVMQGAHNFRKFSIRSGEKIRFANNAAWSSVDVFSTDMAETEAFNQSAATVGFRFLNWALESMDIPMRSTGNPQTTENGFDCTWDGLTVTDAVTAEASAEVAINVNFIDINVIGGAASNTDFGLRLHTAVWETGYAQQRDLRRCFRISTLVIDAATLLPISGATVRLYDSTGVTLRKYLLVSSTSATLADFDFTTDANGETAEAPVVFSKFEPGGANVGTVTALLSAHVSAGRLAQTNYYPFQLQVAKAGYRTFVGMIPLVDEKKRLVISLGTPAVNSGPIMLVGIRP